MLLSISLFSAFCSLLKSSKFRLLVKNRVGWICLIGKSHQDYGHKVNHASPSVCLFCTMPTIPICPTFLCLITSAIPPEDSVLWLSLLLQSLFFHLSLLKNLIFPSLFRLNPIVSSTFQLLLMAPPTFPPLSFLTLRSQRTKNILQNSTSIPYGLHPTLPSSEVPSWTPDDHPILLCFFGPLNPPTQSSLIQGLDVPNKMQPQNQKDILEEVSR